MYCYLKDANMIKWQTANLFFFFLVDINILIEMNSKDSLPKITPHISNKTTYATAKKKIPYNYTLRQTVLPYGIRLHDWNLIAFSLLSVISLNNIRITNSLLRVVTG
jgi:hypothetical protein